MRPRSQYIVVYAHSAAHVCDVYVPLCRVIVYVHWIFVVAVCLLDHRKPVCSDGEVAVATAAAAAHD